MENQQKSRVEQSIELSMKLIRTMLKEPSEKITERDFKLIESCFQMVADGSRLDEWEKQKSYKASKELYEVTTN